MKKSITNSILIFGSTWLFASLFRNALETNGSGDNNFYKSRMGMNNQKLHKIIEEAATITEGEIGFWKIDYESRELYILADETHNRLRVMTPVTQEENLDEEDFKVILLANFDRALDARYALNGGFLWAVYIHPLAELSEEQFLDALDQVKDLANNYGGSYASTNLHFEG